MIITIIMIIMITITIMITNKPELSARQASCPCCTRAQCARSGGGSTREREPGGVYMVVRVPVCLWWSFRWWWWSSWWWRWSSWWWFLWLLWYHNGDHLDDDGDHLDGGFDHLDGCHSHYNYDLCDSINRHTELWSVIYWWWLSWRWWYVSKLLLEWCSTQRANGGFGIN